ncbi:hypothetical protein N0V82_003534 [Gnomoniopsis sp. IMI 355080]|nr:hypothetical protein N0V82_003534 [Gnomoniopsis sp. IMI 355080]
MSTNITSSTDAGTAQAYSGYGLEEFLASLAVSAAVAGVQIGLFFLLRNKLARIYKPKTFLVPERERTDPPPRAPWALVTGLMAVPDRSIINKCGLDAYFFLRYLKTLLVIFVPLACIVLPILIPVNFVDGIGTNLWSNSSTNDTNSVVGLSVLAWGNVKSEHSERRWAHLILALFVIIWVCFVVFSEMRVYVRVRQDWLTSAEHRLRASATTVLVSSIPRKWLTESALRGLFDVFPGGIKNIWLTHDLTALLDKIKKREKVHAQLESAQSDLIRECKKRQLKQRQKDEKKQRKQMRTDKPTKAQLAQRQKDEDREAMRKAMADEGLERGDNAAEVTDVPDEQPVPEEDVPSRPLANLNVLGGLNKVGRVFKDGATVVGRAGHGVKDGFTVVGQGITAVGEGIDHEVDRSGGFHHIQTAAGPSAAYPTIPGRRTPINRNLELDGDKPKVSFASEDTAGRSDYSTSKLSDQQELTPRDNGNTTRTEDNIAAMIITEPTRWYQFWKAPSGGYASPVPQGGAEPEKNDQPFWTKVKSHIPFMGPDEEPVEYPPYVNPGQQEEFQESAGPEWEKWIKPKDRPHHRLPLLEFTPGWLPGLPFIHKKVDTIYWCRQELARLNVEIEEDQKNTDRFPLMTSAFIQFHNQSAAHMACQSVIHHVPKHMAPRVVEINPDDVIWDNMAMSWWMQWGRVVIACAAVVGMVVLWGFPVAFSASLSEIDTLITKYAWLKFLSANANVYKFVKLAAGVLPQVFLAVILALVPIILNFIAGFQGTKTGGSRSEWVQIYYFLFLFVEVFLVVSITSGALQTLVDVAGNIESLPTLLAQNLPDASNYFFSYLLLQGASVSSGTLLQVSALAVWYLLSRILDSTARAKFKRQTQLPQVKWGSFFPVYTNFACIALVFSVIAPLMSLFAILNFSMLWCAHRYNMLYVTRFKTDTGGVLYPRALNQMFTGLYVMELCLVGLFFLVQDDNGEVLCYPQAIIMIVSIFLTALYQIMLNREFGPLMRYLPITFEDEAVLRDLAFEKARLERENAKREEERRQRRLEAGSLQDDNDFIAEEKVDGDANGDASRPGSTRSDNGQYEMNDLRSSQEKTGTVKSHRKNMMSSGGGSIIKHTVKHSMTWALEGGNAVKNFAIDAPGQRMKEHAGTRRRKFQKDLENQRAIGDALFGGFADEIDDLDPAARDEKIRKAFTHSALRVRRPVVWIPRDDIGVSDDEVRRTNMYSDHIWISNVGTALDSRCRVVYGQAPPDFSEEDLIQL